MSSSMWAWRVVVPGLALAVCLAILWPTVRGESPLPSTSNPNANANATSNLVAVTPSKTRVIAEGRVAARPGASVTVGTETGGLIVALPGSEKARVRKGDVLVEFRADFLQLDLVEAESKLLEVEADLNYAKREYERRSKASTEAARFQSELDNTRRDFEVATARRKSAQAGVDRCRLALSRSKVTSSLDGVVIAAHVRPGETVAPGARLVTVCDLTRLWVEAEVDAFDVPRIKLGDDVTITSEGYGEASWSGRVEDIPDQVAERSVRPEDPGRPTDTRVLLVKIRLDQPSLPLKLGQVVEVEIKPHP